MEDVKRFLFYSKKEKILFYVAGYTDNSNKVTDIIEMLNEGSKRVTDLVQADVKEAKTFMVEQSRRYKHMRVFYLENIEAREVPKDAYQFGKDWTMSKWLQD